MDEIRRILVVSRMTGQCSHAVSCGVSLAKRFGARLWVLHLIDEPVDMQAVNVPGVIFRDEYRNYLNGKEEVREEIDRVISGVLREGLHVNVMLRNGDPLDEVAAVVRQEGIDLVVLMAHEEGRLEHILFGGDNDAIIRRMPSSILLVKKEPEAVSWE